MGTDNIHRKKKAESFERKNPQRPAGKRYLIVCEGEKTEPHYFKELRHGLRLRTTLVKVCGEECGSDPVSVFRYAERLYEEEKFSVYDAVYCVIDKDDHKNLDEAIRLIGNKGDPFVCVLSYPCFEYWLLLHYELCRTSFQRTARKSIADVVASALRKYDKGYLKAKPGIWLRYKDLLPVAMRNAAEIEKISTRTGNLNPSTDIHKLVGLLLALDS